MSYFSFTEETFQNMSSSKGQIEDYMLREHYHLAFLSLPDTRTSRAVLHTVLDHHYITMTSAQCSCGMISVSNGLNFIFPI